MSSTCKPFFKWIISGCIKEYDMKINGKMSKVVCINEAKKERSWNFGGCEIDEVEEYKYLGVNVKASLNGGFGVWGTEWWMQTEYLVWYNMQLHG